jgi:NAD-dependent dihydropyrimidine dehydrogenase PreA subunit
MKELLERYADTRSVYVLARLDFPEETDCFIWRGTMVDHHPRPNKPARLMATMKIRNRREGVARFLWNLSVPAGQELLPKERIARVCQTERCVNPEHYRIMSNICPKGHIKAGDKQRVMTHEYTTSEGEVRSVDVLECYTCNREATGKAQVKRAERSKKIEALIKQHPEIFADL